MDSGKEHSNKRALVEFIMVVVLVIAAPIMVAAQSSQANEPWDDMWMGNWPPLLEHDRSGPDPRSAGLHERAAVSLARISKPRGDAQLARKL